MPEIEMNGEIWMISPHAETRILVRVIADKEFKHIITVMVDEV